YVALSHCWGKEQPLKTRNKEDLIEWKKDIPWARLPRTFQDAIQVTAFLGYRFLWIDSICIIQEDQEDWERQSAKMGSIYQNSLLTIAAAAASGHEKGMLELLDHKFLLDPIDPIDMRAWTYQERLLPPRSLLYSTAEMKWECNAIHCCECGMNNTKFQDDRHDYNFRNVAQFTKAEALHFWYTRVVPVYSRRNLTKGTDKLPALSGVVARLSPRIEGRYLGGIWEQHVIFGLSWVASHTIPYPRPIELCPSYQAPTFSWASISGGVRY
ncbi:HET-domain-containing protein, partial [Lophium mytilinum]